VAVHVMTLTDSIEEVGRVAASIESWGSREGIPRRAVLDLQLALEEILTNVISYAFEGIEERSISVDWSLHDHQIELHIVDNGRPFNPLNIPDAETGKSADERRIGGLGIFLARRMMDRMKYQRENQRNILTLWKSWS
jgi:anti-sigma regulatory factor (Ser/Thr protein kinase)